MNIIDAMKISKETGQKFRREAYENVFLEIGPSKTPPLRVEDVLAEDWEPVAGRYVSQPPPDGELADPSNWTMTGVGPAEVSGGYVAGIAVPPARSEIGELVDETLHRLAKQEFADISADVAEMVAARKAQRLKLGSIGEKPEHTEIDKAELIARLREAAKQTTFCPELNLPPALQGQVKRAIVRLCEELHISETLSEEVTGEEVKPDVVIGD